MNIREIVLIACTILLCVTVGVTTEKLATAYTITKDVNVHWMDCKTGGKVTYMRSAP